MAEPTFDHERFDLYRLSIDYVAFSYQIDEVRADEAKRLMADGYELALNWFRVQGRISAGMIEGLSNKAKRSTRKSYGFRSCEAVETALYHSLGALPEPEFTHRFR